MTCSYWAILYYLKAVNLQVVLDLLLQVKFWIFEIVRVILIPQLCCAQITSFYVKRYVRLQRYKQFRLRLPSQRVCIQEGVHAIHKFQR